MALQIAVYNDNTREHKKVSFSEPESPVVGPACTRARVIIITLASPSCRYQFISFKLPHV